MWALRVRQGFSLVEVLVALALTGLVSATVLRVVWDHQRLYRRQLGRVELQQTLRAVAGIVSAELRELEPAEAAGGDLLETDSTTVSYQAMRSLYLTCEPPDTTRRRVKLRWVGGVRGLDASQDRVLLYAERDSTTPTDDGWIAADLLRTSVVTGCGGAGGLTATLAGVTGAELAGVAEGAPVRGYEAVQLTTYRDARGEQWLGLRQRRKLDGAWIDLQPVAGPLAGRGFALSYLTAAGALARTPAEVASIRMTVIVRLPELGAPPESVTTQVALRNTGPI